MSQYLARLDALLSEEIDETKRSEIQAQRAAYVARIGNFEEARQIVASVREKFGRGQSGRVSVRLMLAEGLIHAFERYSAEGLDRIMRAQALATALRYRDLAALTSAWRAHCQSERSEFAGMARSLSTALAVVDDDDHDSMARIAMTLANAFASCGEAKLAAAWYAACRHHALEAGDRATIEAMLYNKASFALAWIRAESCLGSPSSEIAQKIRRELSSAKNLHAMEGVAAGSSYMRLWEARALMATAEFSQAQEILESLLHAGEFADYNVSPALLQLEAAYCAKQQGAKSETVESFAAGASAEFDALHEDEQLAAAWLLAELSAGQAAFGDSDARHSELELARTMFRDSVQELKTTLEPFKASRMPGVPEAVTRVFR